MNRKIPTLNKTICLHLLLQKILGRFYEHVNTAVLTQEWAAKKNNYFNSLHTGIYLYLLKGADHKHCF